MGIARAVRRVVTGSRQVDGAGVELLRVLGHAEVRDFDPFLMLDAFDSRDPADYVRGFPWHPHRGIETVTYLIAGRIEHRDSLGNRGAIVDGGCQWMTAGRGILHQEMPQPSAHMLGLQLWLNLPRTDKLVAPTYRDLPAERIPRIREAGVEVGVIAGTYGRMPGATQGEHVPALVLDVRAEPGARRQIPVDPEATLFAYLIDGQASFEPDGRSVERRCAALFGPGDRLGLQAGPEGLRLVLFAARPLREPVAWGGPIVMNTPEELAQAFEELRRGEFVR